MIGLVILLLFLVIIILDLTKKLELTSFVPRLLYGIIMPHGLLVLTFLFHGDLNELSGGKISSNLIIIAFIAFHFYSTLRLHLFPFRKDESHNTRTRIMYGGVILTRLGILSMFLQIPVYLYLIRFSHITQYYAWSLKWIWIDLVYCILFILLFLINGSLRILFTCRKIGIIKRILVCLNIWIPFLNLFLMHYITRMAKDEYAIAVERHFNATLRQASMVSQTKYPLVMVHGIGFRDLKYLNYWGRIPVVLKQNGAIVYYGHQNGWGTIEENGAAIGQTIDRALKETGAEKVNIIAHSKGGLDSRYAISHLGYADKVASLTTMSTPHYGSELINFLNKLPDGLYRFLAGQLDKPLKKLGDEHPDCYLSSKQLAPSFCETFNKENPDMPGILYQSYASVMKGLFSDTLLTIPYFIMRCLTHEANDGLVKESSAHWGEFKGTLRNKNYRGISHGDMIDLKREDIKGFDILETYIHITQELKEKGL